MVKLKRITVIAAEVNSNNGKSVMSLTAAT